jgi:hypothetical protein
MFPARYARRIASRMRIRSSDWAVATIASAAMTACAAPATQGPPADEYAVTRAEPTRSTGWVALEPNGSRTDDAARRAEVLDRRRELLARCDEVLDSLAMRRRSLGSVPAQIATSVATQSLAGAAAMQQSAVTGHPAPAPLPLPGGVGLAETVRVDRQIAAIREGRQSVVTAERTADVLDAMDRLRPHCNAR